MIFSKNVIITLSIPQIGQNSILNNKWAGKVCAFSTWKGILMKDVIPESHTYPYLALPELDELGSFIFYWHIQSYPGF